MSTFLELCQDLTREAGMSGGGTSPTAVASQVGEMKRAVEWILTAYEAVQNLHPDWLFLQTEFSFPTIAGTANYTKAAASLTELGNWKDDSFRCYLTATGVSDQQDLEFVPWQDFRSLYGRGSMSTQTGRPQVITIKPDLSVTTWPISDAVYTVTGEYYKRAQTMTADADEPLIPQEHQPIIVWKALMYYGAFAAADEKYSHGQNEYRAALSAMRAKQLPEMRMGEAMT
jgi:hypothetical protein